MGVAEISRNKNQEIIFQIYFAFLVYQKLNLQINFKQMVEDIYGDEYDNINVYTKEVLIKSLKYKDSAVQMISKYLKKWKFDRLNYCTQALLIISVVNYFYLTENSKAIIINVAVNLAKKYCDETDFKLINAILDRCLDDSNKQQ